MKRAFQWTLPFALAGLACGNRGGLVGDVPDAGSTAASTTTNTTTGTTGVATAGTGSASGSTGIGGTSGVSTGTTSASTSGSTTSGAILPPLALDAGCNPLLAGYDCFLPYPTDFFRAADASSPTGYWIETKGAAKLTTQSGASADVTDFRPLDGYSHLPAVTAVFPQAIAATGFVGLFDDPSASTAPASAMLLIDATSQQPVPSWVDLDPRATDPTRQAIVLHPLVALGYQTRYVVGIHGVQSPDGGLVATPEGFRRLRDEQTAGDPVLGPLQSHYDQDIFPVLADAGVPRADLQLAWDFTTGDEAQADGDMLQVRALTLAWLASNTPIATVTSDTQNADPTSWRQIQGVVTGPQFVSGALPGASINHDASGKVAQNGSTVFTFTANVPVSVRDQFGPGRTVSYGHGFFGSQAEVTYGDTEQIADALHAVFISIDWLGMSTADGVLLAANLATKPSQALSVLERVPQAMANFMVLQAALRGPLKGSGLGGLLGPNAFQRPSSGAGQSLGDAGQSNAGDDVYDGLTTNYLGISQGAILGGTLNALSPDFQQVVLNVGGACFTQLMWRSVPFNDFLTEIAVSFPDALDQQKYAATMQPQFDRVDPATYAPYVLQHPLAGSPTRHVLQQNGLGDPEVPNLGTYLEARLLGVVQLSPNDNPVFGLTQQAAPIDGSALTLWDFGLDVQAIDGQATPPSLTGNPVHDDVRLEPTVLAQMDAFLWPGGAIVNPCNGGVCYATDGGLGFLPDGG